MDYVRASGSNYGLTFNWKKLENMPVRCNAEFFTPTGDPIQLKQSFKYLGSMLSSSGKAGTELSCRLGASRKEFDNLCRVWSHAALSKQKKHRIYIACVVSKLMYALETLYLNAAEIRKLDAFHHRCLRRIAGVKPSFYSHVSNQSVRDSLQAEPLKQVLLKRQLLYFGYLAAKPSNNVLRNFVFASGSVMLRPVDGPRRKGRPRSNWIQYLHKISLDIVGGDSSRLENLWASTRAAKSAWREAVGQYCAVAL